MNRKRDIFYKYEKVLLLAVNILKLFPKRLSYTILRMNRLNSSILGIAINYICIKRLAKKCGRNVAIFSNVYLLNIENLSIGDNVSIHPMSYIDAKGKISIGNNVSIAHGSTILSEEHIYSDININIKDQGMIQKKTIIQDNVWIGCGARILAGTEISSGSIVAAGAVVAKNIEENIVVGGVPAKFIKTRN